jgi:transcriptional regulator with XRE-family HTH domain
MQSPAIIVAEMRCSAGLSQRALAARAGCTRSTIVRIEQGEMDPTITMLARITAAMGHRLIIRADQTLRKESLAGIAQRASTPSDADTPFTLLRGLIDWLRLHPELTTDAVSDPPQRTDSANLNNLLAAIANKLADDQAIQRPAWTADVPVPMASWYSPGTPRMAAVEAAHAPRQFVERRIFFAVNNFWRRDG